MTIPRLDVVLVQRGLARSRGHARDLVLDGKVSVGGRTARRPSHRVSDEASVTVSDAGPTWVSRGALKLLHAIEVFAEDGLGVTGRRCLDVGASTGGFTQVLLHHGAASVVALDVGTDQLAPVVASDPRVVELSGTTVRGLAADDVGGPVQLLVADLSFISLALVLPTMADLLVPGGDLVVLVKPQFEVGRAALDKRGVVRSPHDRRRALDAVIDVARTRGLTPRGLAASPVTGGEGNVEYLLWVSAPPSVGSGGHGRPEPTPDTATWEALSARADELASEGGRDR